MNDEWIEESDKFRPRRARSGSDGAMLALSSMTASTIRDKRLGLNPVVARMLAPMPPAFPMPNLRCALNPGPSKAAGRIARYECIGASGTMLVAVEPALLSVLPRVGTTIHESLRDEEDVGAPAKMPNRFRLLSDSSATVGGDLLPPSPNLDAEALPKDPPATLSELVLDIDVDASMVSVVPSSTVALLVPVDPNSTLTVAVVAAIAGANFGASLGALTVCEVESRPFRFDGPASLLATSLLEAFETLKSFWIGAAIQPIAVGGRSSLVDERPRSSSPSGVTVPLLGASENAWSFSRDAKEGSNVTVLRVDRSWISSASKSREAFSIARRSVRLTMLMGSSPLANDGDPTPAASRAGLN